MDKADYYLFKKTMNEKSESNMVAKPVISQEILKYILATQAWKILQKTDYIMCV